MNLVITYLLNMWQKVQPYEFSVGYGLLLFKLKTKTTIYKFRLFPIIGKVEVDLNKCSDLKVRLVSFGGPLFSGIICCLGLLYSLSYGYMNILNFIDLSLKYISFTLSDKSYSFNDEFIKSLCINIFITLAFFSATINLIPMYLADGSFIIFGNKTYKYKKILIVNYFIVNISLGLFCYKIYYNFNVNIKIF